MNKNDNLHNMSPEPNSGAELNDDALETVAGGSHQDDPCDTCAQTASGIFNLLTMKGRTVF